MTYLGIGMDLRKVSTKKWNLNVNIPDLTNIYNKNIIMRRTIRLTERDLTRLVKRVMNEDKDNKKMDLKSDFNDIINHEYYSEIEPSDLVEVLEELLHYAKNDVFRSKKPNKGYITKDEVIKNFKKNYN
jgi:Asp-tRNA(Asn)/Glu-tRNA(Gln) amidotransferase C subunit